MRDLEWLEEEFAALDRVFWHGELEARGVTVYWGRWRRTKKWFRAGAFEHATNKIEINPVLRHDWVPHSFVSAILYHEMVHASRPDNQAHDRAFWAAERKHPYADEAEVWWSANVVRLTAELPPRARTS